jgi:arginine exporter protein ArgO
MDLHTWLIYLLAAIGLSLSPGPNGLLALTHGALHGRGKALFTISGGCLGFVLLIALSMFGIGALLKASGSASAQVVRTPSMRTAAYGLTGASRPAARKQGKRPCRRSAASRRISSGEKKRRYGRATSDYSRLGPDSTSRTRTPP